MQGDESRRRHTRSLCDWSSDVCSSDLIEARDSEVAVKYRIDGVLQHAMQPIAKEHHSAMLSRIKVLSELDIAERRVPQDGRFRVKYKGRRSEERRVGKEYRCRGTRAEDGIRDHCVTGVQTCALPISSKRGTLKSP